MPYVGKDTNGNVTEIYARPQPNKSLEYVEGHVDIYQSDAQKAAIELRETDKDMARVAEDVIATLISKGLIALSDLPQSAQDKINERALLRGRL